MDGRSSGPTRTQAPAGAFTRGYRSSRGGEQPRGVGASHVVGGDAALEAVESVPELDAAGLVALAVPDVDQADPGVEVGVQATGLGDAHPGVEEGGEEGVVEGAGGGGLEQGVDLLAQQGQDVLVRPLPGPRDRGHHLGLPEGLGVEDAQGGVVDHSGRRRQADLLEVEQVGAGLLGAEAVRGLLEVPGELGDVAQVVGAGRGSEVAKAEVFLHLVPERRHGFSFGAWFSKS